MSTPRNQRPKAQPEPARIVYKLPKSRWIKSVAVHEKAAEELTIVFEQVAEAAYRQGQADMIASLQGKML